MKKTLYHILNTFLRPILTVLLIGILSFNLFGQVRNPGTLAGLLNNPPESAKPWVFWYWMHASFSREGITADLEAMKEAGIGGAYLAPIKPKTDPPLFEPVIETLSPEWWEIIRFTFKEADRIGIKIAMLPNDGFATAGGTWITPELSMQKVVSSELHIIGGSLFNDTLPQPPSNQGYYRDIVVFAYPISGKNIASSHSIIPKVTSSKSNEDIQFLAVKGNKKNFSSDEPCWIQYEFEKPFTCRSIKIHVNNFNHQSNRLLIEVSDNGKDFRSIGRLEPPRAGWEDWDADVTHSIKLVTSRYFRFVYNKEGSEPGSEDLDAAKWKQSLKIAGIELSSQPKIHQFEGKTGEVWRISQNSTGEQLPDSLCIPLNKMIDISSFLDKNGRLKWKAPSGTWTIIRIGSTSTGHKNETAGAGKGLECDKFNPEAVKVQFDHWFGEAIRVAGPDLASKVLKIFHVDSWECGSQNWSPVFREEFKKRRGYDLFSHLPVMAGIPIESADFSERFLLDIRKTIAELITDNFFKTLARLAHEKGCEFSSETVAPVMTSDDLLHFSEVDIPMGEFWLRSPSHDKPNDMLDAISGAHIYGKNIVQSEAFTEIRMAWDEHPGMLKTLQDRNYALGVNRLVYHVFVHNPWKDRKPGMTLDGVGLYFQRNQTWWKPGKAWVEYAQRCQVLLQQGRPVKDIAVFTGEELPSRAILPDRLVSTLPGIFGKERVELERKRKENAGLPLRKVEGVTTLENMSDSEDWINPLNGYAYDSFNPDALLRLAKVNDGNIVFEGGSTYKILVFPGKHPMNPNNIMSQEVASRLLELVKEGGTILLSEKPSPETNNPSSDHQQLTRQLINELWEGQFEEIMENDASILVKNIGKGKVLKGPFNAPSFNKLGIGKDLIVTDSSGKYAKDIAWNHRASDNSDIYFISNQLEKVRTVELSLRISGKLPELYDAVSNKWIAVKEWRQEAGRTLFSLMLESNASMFIVFREKVTDQIAGKGKNWIEKQVLHTIESPWRVAFDRTYGGPTKEILFNQLTDWSKHSDSLIRYYSGTATYTNTFNIRIPNSMEAVWLDLGKIANIAHVKVNGIECGVAWTYPYQVEISKAIMKGKNHIQIEVTNTWANRLIGDQALSPDKRITKTTAPFRLDGKPLLEAGLLGPVTIKTIK